MSLFKRFSKLHWKLAVSYVGVTLLTVLALEAAISLAVILFGTPIGNALATQSALQQARQLAELVAVPLEDGSSAQVGHVLEQHQYTAAAFFIFEGSGQDAEWALWLSVSEVVIGSEGNVVASNQPSHYRPGAPFSEPGLPEAEELVADVLAGGGEGTRVAREPSVTAAVVPIANSGGERLGALYYRQPALGGPTTLADSALSLLATTLVALPCLVPLGFVFGFVTAKSFTRRLRRLADASSALEGGDLTSRVGESSADEIGQLARQFDRMAEQIEADTAQLQELADRNARLARRSRRLAALEERHRLARDLHDGVKQHLFGVNLAAAAALNELDSDPQAARARLVEAAEHSRQAQAEMEALLNELRPAGLDKRGLVAALADHVAAFERAENIAVEWQPPETADLRLPLTHKQALFRVAQQALANVARHAQARSVRVQLSARADAVTLVVSDDGQGFDSSAAESGPTMGLRGMRERLETLGGTLAIDTTPGAGTCLTARLPRPNLADEEGTSA